MELLSAFDFSLLTLAACMALPFVWFCYHVTYWWKLQRLQIFDLAIVTAAIALGVGIFAKLFSQFSLMSGDDRILAALHIPPLLFVILARSLFRRVAIPQQMRPPTERSKNPDKVNAAESSETVGVVEYVGWDEIIVDDSVKEELSTVVRLLREPDAARSYGIQIPKGILLCGPPGTGKTTIAKVIASTAGMSFFALRLDEVISKWVGDSEKNLSKLFDAARRSAPAVIFVDEIDSIGRARSGAQPWADNLVNHLLQLIDGVVRTEGVYIIGATNRIDLVDSALLRGGRLSKHIHIPVPDRNSRAQLFALFLSKLRIADDVNLAALADITAGRSGADIREICNRAGMNAFKREAGLSKRDRKYSVTLNDLMRALDDVLEGGSYANTGTN